MKIEIDDMDMDQIMGPALLEAIEMTYDEIVGLQSQDLESYQQEDLDYDLQLLPALKTVYKYYNVQSEYYKLDEYDITDLDLNKQLEEANLNEQLEGAAYVLIRRSQKEEVDA